jgi:hypothetical protein
MSPLLMFWDLFSIQSPLGKRNEKKKKQKKQQINTHPLSFFQKKYKIPHFAARSLEPLLKSSLIR